MKIVYMIGYFSSLVVLGLLPLFVYSIYTYPKHPLVRGKTSRERFRYMFLLGSFWSVFSITLAIGFIELAEYYPRTGGMFYEASLISGLELILAIITLYVSVYLPVAEVRKEMKARAEHLVRKRYEHRKYYYKYKNEERERSDF